MASVLVAAWLSYHVARWFYEQGYQAGRDQGTKNLAWFAGIGKRERSVPGTSVAAGEQH